MPVQLPFILNGSNEVAGMTICCCGRCIRGRSGGHSLVVVTVRKLVLQVVSVDVSENRTKKDVLCVVVVVGGDAGVDQSGL